MIYDYKGLVILQFSTTRWKDGGYGVRAFLNSMRFHWQARYSYAIRLMCHSPFSHVDMVMPDGSLLGASSMGKASPYVEGNPNGVAIRPANYQEFGYRRRMILKTDLAGAVYAAALSQLGKPFDNSALRDFLSSQFPGYRDWRDKGAWFCAELAVWSLESAGYYGRGLPWPKNRVSPTDQLMLHINDPNWLNRDTFWDPIEGMILPPWES